MNGPSPTLARLGNTHVGEHAVVARICLQARTVIQLEKFGAAGTR